jgi:hypothetical protein
LEQEADEMIDLHLINVALASLGISAVAAVLIAAAVITVAAVGRHRTAARGQQAQAPAEGPTSVRAGAPAGEGGRVDQALREPALR